MRRDSRAGRRGAATLGGVGRVRPGHPPGVGRVRPGHPPGVGRVRHGHPGRADIGRRLSRGIAHHLGASRGRFRASR